MKTRRTNPSFFLALFAVVALLFSSCKVNMEAYKQAYQRIKEKEDAQVNDRARTTMQVSVPTQKGDSTVVLRSETFTLLAGDVNILKNFNLVAKSFINRTNAKAYFGRMVEQGYPALLVQNQEQLYRIIIGSFESLEQANARKTELSGTFPEAMVVLKKQ